MALALSLTMLIIKFDSNTAGQTATFIFPSVPDTEYVISVTGQTNQSSSFVQFFIDADGPGAGDFAQLGGNINFGSGFNPITLPTFTDLGTSDFLQIVNGGTGNSGAQISAITITPLAEVNPVGNPWQFLDLSLARASPRFSA